MSDKIACITVLPADTKKHHLACECSIFFIWGKLSKTQCSTEGTKSNINIEFYLYWVPYNEHSKSVRKCIGDFVYLEEVFYLSMGERGFKSNTL